MKTATPSRSGVSVRAILVGLLLVAVNAYWVGIASELWYSVYTLVNPFSNAVFTLAMLLVVNVGLKRWLPSMAFTSAELLLVYVMVTTVSTISGHAFMAILMGALAHPFWYATPENQYVELFHRFIPDWMTVGDPEQMRGYFDGGSSLYVGDHWRVWIRPALIWSAFICAVYGSYLSVSILLRKQWMEHEKLTFPLTQLPIQMTTNDTFWKSKALWVGFAIAASIRALNAAGDLFPV
ncbi:MAG: hypothetical protein O3A46_16535, partial [Candidatus Poribacteria bacterium]|nr:hypothetical protein [Candidatus Poribacteria bacterium]